MYMDPVSDALSASFAETNHFGNTKKNHIFHPKNVNVFKMYHQEIKKKTWSGFGIWPLPSNSDHQDYHILVGNPYI